MQTWCANRLTYVKATFLPSGEKKAARAAPGCAGSSRVIPVNVTACRYGPVPSAAGPLATNTSPSGCHAFPASVNPGGVTGARAPLARSRSSIPFGVSSAMRAPSGEKEANEEETRIVLTLNRSGAARQ
jgi:hypothetical protein